MIKRKNNKKESPARKGAVCIRPTDDGLHLDGSILWFDSHANGRLSFLSSAQNSSHTKVPQVITTEETIKILETKRQKINALVCQYNRPFSIGRLKMELLPSGNILGGASLYVENGDYRILYAPHIQTNKSSIVRQMQLKKASTLVVGAFHQNPTKPLPNRKKEKERLVKRINSFLSEGEFPIVLCRAMGTAQEVTKVLADAQISLAVHSSIYRINRIYESYGANLGKYSHYSKHTKNKVVILPLNSRGRAPIRTRFPDRPVIYVEETSEESSSPEAFHSNVAERFFISTSSDGRDLREVIQAVNPKEVYVFGPYTKQYCEDFKNLSCDIKPLYSNGQAALF